MAAAGYEISVAASNSEATSLNPNNMAYTNINFGTASYGSNDQSNKPYMPSTSTATAALGNASQGGNSVGNGYSEEEVKPGITPEQKKLLLIGGSLAAVAVIAAVIYFRK